MRPDKADRSNGRSKIVGLFRSFLDSGIGPGEPRQEDLVFMHRVRTVNICCLLGVVVGSLFRVIYLLLGAKILALFHVVIVLACLGNIWFLRITKRPELAGHVTIIIVLAFLAALNSGLGGFRSPALLWLFVLPIGAGFMINLRSSLIYGALAALVLGGFFFLHLIGIPPPSVIPHGHTDWFFAITMLSALAVFVILTFGFLSTQLKAEMKLRESERRFRDIANSSADHIWELDAEGRYTWIHSRGAGAKLYSSEEMIGRTLFDFMPEGESDRIRAYFLQKAKAREPIKDLELAVFTEAHEEIVVLMSAVPVFDEDARLLGYRGMSKDVTERVRAKEALMKSEKRYRTLVENVPVAVYRSIPGPKGRFLMANPTFLKMFGLESEEELKEISVAHVYMNPKERKAFSDNLLANGTVTDVELPLRKKDGTLFWGSVTARVVYDEGGKAPYFDWTIMDITAQKTAEEEKEKLQAQLLQTQKVGRIIIGGVSKARLALTWGPEPRDLDAHLTIPADTGRKHIYYMVVGDLAAGARLNTDDTNGYGPEIITIYKFEHDGVYRFAVHHFAGLGNISCYGQNIAAHLEVPGLGLYHFTPPPAAIGIDDVWLLCDLVVSNATVVSVNSLNTYLHNVADDDINAFSP